MLCFLPYNALYSDTYDAYRRTAALTKPAHISGVMWRSIEARVGKVQAENFLIFTWRRSQLLPMEIISSTGLKSGLYGGKKHTITPAASNTATAAWSCTRALSRMSTQKGCCWSHVSAGLYLFVPGSTELIKNSKKSTDNCPWGGFVTLQSTSPPCVMPTTKLVAKPLEASMCLRKRQCIPRRGHHAAPTPTCG